MLTLCSFGFKSLSCHFGEIYWIELPRTKSSHPTHPVNWIDGVEIICVNCSRFLWCFVLLLFVLVPWTDHQTHLTGMFGPLFSIDLETNLTRSNWPPAHPRSQGNKRACSCVAAKITLLPNNCNWYIHMVIYDYLPTLPFQTKRQQNVISWPPGDSWKVWACPCCSSWVDALGARVDRCQGASRMGAGQIFQKKTVGKFQNVLIDYNHKL